MAQYLTPNNIRWFTGGAVAGAKYYDELDNRIQAAKRVGSILRQRYNRYYYTGSLKKKYTKPLGATNSTRLVARKTVKRRYSKMPMRRMKRRGTRRVYRKRVSKKSRWQTKARMMVGQRRGASTSKTTESVLPGILTAVNKQVFSTKELINIDTTTSNSINDRIRETCVISGIKVNVSFLNQANSQLFVNWAIIHPKQGQTVNTDTADMFRDYTNVRAWDANAVNKTGITWSDAQINSDEFLVLKRGKFMLTPAASQSLRYNYGGATKEKKLWLKLNRQFYFDDGQTRPQDKLYFVCWGADPNDGSTPSPATGFQYRIRAIIYFRDPKTG